MPATPLDSALYRDLLGDAEVAKLFTDTAEIRAMLLVEGALAKAQGGVGMIPEISAKAIHRASLEAQIDPAALARETGANAVPVPALVAAFRTEIGAPEHAQYVHWGATSQDITDTGLVLRLRQVFAIFEARLDDLLSDLGRLAADHADLPMTGRTYGQAAVPTSFGAVVAGWGWPLLALREDLAALRAQFLNVSLSGAAGTLGAMGEHGSAVRKAMAEALDLGDPGRSWHNDRNGVAALAAWLTAVSTALGRIGEDLVTLARSEIGEVTLGAAGASSTMPQKQNPVGPSVLSALSRTAVALNSAVQGAAVHRDQRDASAWITEWLTLPQLCILTGRGLATALDVSSGLAPVPDRMRSNLDRGGGAIHAEALTFSLARTMPRPEAQAKVKGLVTEARSQDRDLANVAIEAFPDLDPALFDPVTSLGQAPAEARAFAGRTGH